MKPCSHVRSSVTADGVLLMDIRTGQIFSANAVAARIWSGLEEGLSIPAIVDAIVQQTGADAATVERDAVEFLNTLRVRALIGDL